MDQQQQQQDRKVMVVEPMPWGGPAVFDACLVEGGFDEPDERQGSFNKDFSYRSNEHDFMSSWKATDDDSKFIGE